jgi:hypothetical protein
METRIDYFKEDLDIPLVVEFDFVAVMLYRPDPRDPLTPDEDPIGDLEVTDIELDEDALMAYFRIYGYGAEDDVRERIEIFNEYKEHIMDELNESDLKWEIRDNWISENDGI